MPPLVVDASALAAWILPDEDGSRVGAVLVAQDDLIAPWLIWPELRNVLIVNERRGRIPVSEVQNALAEVDDLGIALDTAPNSHSVMTLAREYHLSAYDALYLELALRRNAALLSFDSRLVAAARTCGVPLA